MEKNQSPSKNSIKDFRLYLQNELITRCKANPRYSLRAFAKFLHTDYSTLSKLLRGKRKLGEKTILKLSNRLGLNPSEAKKFLSHKSDEERNTESNYQQLALDSFQIIADWYHYAILELMRVDNFKPTPNSISKALGITINEVNAAIERLKRVGILEIKKDGTWIDTSGGTSTTLGNEFTATAFRKHQRQVLEKAIYALENVDYSKRDQSSMTMAIDADKLAEAKNKITTFRRNLAKFLSRGNKRNEVYNLSISLYPISDIQRKEKK